MHKFINNEYDRKQTMTVLKKHYDTIKLAFINQIARQKSYPYIDWLDFVDLC